MENKPSDIQEALIRRGYPEMGNDVMALAKDRDELWDEVIKLREENNQLRDELADDKLHALDTYDALHLACNLVPFLPLKDATRSQEDIQVGFKQALNRAEKNLTRILETTE